MQPEDGNHLIDRVADSHMPTRIMESEVHRLFSLLQLFVLYETRDHLRENRLRRCSGSENGRRSLYPKS
jgi:hypothetical protein